MVVVEGETDARFVFCRDFRFLERSALAALLELHSSSLSEAVDGKSTLKCASPGQQRGQENARARRRTRRAGSRAREYELSFCRFVTMKLKSSTDADDVHPFSS